MSLAGLLTLTDYILSWHTLDYTARYFQWFVVIMETYTLLVCLSIRTIKESLCFLIQSKRRYLWTLGPVQKPITGQQPALLQSTSQNEYLNSQSTTYILSVHMVWLWNDFHTSASYKDHHTLGILRAWSPFLTLQYV